ncbi:aspartate-semialdehyde dehydrogenase [Isachenkonia alkalipeptolytica]|uniref:Aspartate-semialdehyde dehydrogenase n=1 Tax=Isachenkonia alkalipeptolytica TaxID=2565777 RepID=A0AA43XHH8_9CLOT|nr:aspartate-semialdehyde dehydrogenase [Isachenkonia alkalipeptolytica]NBG87033.1 aspartate-semialdehyde dehydrogenase [Isachenkonia alkalipeptolytica]
MSLKIGIVGGTGNVGRKILQVLTEQRVDIQSLRLFASKKSQGEKISFQDRDITVEQLTEEAMQEEFDYLLFSAGGEVSEHYAPIAAKSGNTVIDNSSQWRMTEGIPLVVPEINGDILKGYQGIVANPNCSTIQMVAALSPLNEVYGLTKINVATYQAVSGSGSAGMQELQEQLADPQREPRTYPKTIAGNCIPHIDVFYDNGYTKEELKMVYETQKILNKPTLPVQVTTVRVPVINGHSEAIYAEFEKAPDLQEVREIFEKTQGLVLMDKPGDLVYPTVFDAHDRDEVFVGRIRKDLFNPKGLALWVVADNLRKGAATNGVGILTHMEKLKKVR